MTNADKLILVVDDEESMRHYLTKTLGREGYEVIAASDGPEALCLAQERPPDLALVDVRMPGMDGVAVMRSLRATKNSWTNSRPRPLRDPRWRDLLRLRRHLQYRTTANRKYFGRT